jgi:hypothetical protein
VSKFVTPPDVKFAFETYKVNVALLVPSTFAQVMLLSFKSLSEETVIRVVDVVVVK